jgi:hypothetical protein
MSLLAKRLYSPFSDVGSYSRVGDLQNHCPTFESQMSVRSCVLCASTTSIQTKLADLNTNKQYNPKSTEILNRSEEIGQFVSDRVREETIRGSQGLFCTLILLFMIRTRIVCLFVSATPPCSSLAIKTVTVRSDEGGRKDGTRRVSRKRPELVANELQGGGGTM